jgi:hypothetical protein
VPQVQRLFLLVKPTGTQKEHLKPILQNSNHKYDQQLERKQTTQFLVTSPHYISYFVTETRQQSLFTKDEQEREIACGGGFDALFEWLLCHIMQLSKGTPSDAEVLVIFADIVAKFGVRSAQY